MVELATLDSGVAYRLRDSVARQPRAISIPDGFVEIDFTEHTVCTLDGAIEQPGLVVQAAEYSDEVWQACTRYDAFGKRRNDVRYMASCPYWHPVVRVGDIKPEPPTADQAVVVRQEVSYGIN